MKELHKYIRTYIYLSSILVAFFIIIFAGDSFGALKLTQWFGLASLVYLYITLLASPLYTVFPRLPYKSYYIRARKALGICSFVFSLPHAYLGFFSFVGGFEGLRYWSSYYTVSLIFGLISLIILTVLAVTSITSIQRLLGRRWKYIHRSVYIAGICVLIHSMTVTIHILNLKSILAVAYVCMLFLCGLEIMRLDRSISKKYAAVPERFIAWIGVPVVSCILFWSFFFVNHHTH